MGAVLCDPCGFGWSHWAVTDGGVRLGAGVGTDVVCFWIWPWFWGWDWMSPIWLWPGRVVTYHPQKFWREASLAGVGHV